ncbi:hypothetical protein BTA51_03570 [Hahella sp. CCB-MM4]|uniref:alpha/beta hydrolase n=1 Tax=Hahella sp. (strain CCB-MM4) TaxID=1926491 RepID=UPI000B9C05DC|nr:alpha/beta hydrolase [Hahella sp. CCB-MM4]OZG75464.1 hypothetical protein BTA51_03570 [Hahella sp. CCB-MM4]
MFSFLEDQFIFPGCPPNPFAYSTYKSHEIWLKSGGVNLQGWNYDVPQPASSAVMLYFGGNAEDITQMFDCVSRWGVKSVFTFNYRGYGNSEGRPSQSALYEDALRIYDYLISSCGIDPRKIVLLGRSLGSSVATYLSSQRKIEKTILVTPFDNLASVGKYHFPFLPVGSLLGQRFPSAEFAGTIDESMLMVVAEQDEVIPTTSSMALYDLWKGRKDLCVIAQACHNDLHLNELFDKAIYGYLVS